MSAVPKIVLLAQVRAQVIARAIEIYGNADDGYLPGFNEKSIPNAEEVNIACARLFREFDDVKDNNHLTQLMKAAARRPKPSRDTPLNLVRGLQFWKNVSMTLNLSAMNAIRGLLLPLVRLLFATPASSASPERVFSSASYIQAGRERLSPTHLHQLTVVRDYIRQDDYDFKDLYEKSEVAVKEALANLERSGQQNPPAELAQ